MARCASRTWDRTRIGTSIPWPPPAALTQRATTVRANCRPAPTRPQVLGFGVSTLRKQDRKTYEPVLKNCRHPKRSALLWTVRRAARPQLGSGRHFLCEANANSDWVVGNFPSRSATTAPSWPRNAAIISRSWTLSLLGAPLRQQRSVGHWTVFPNGPSAPRVADNNERSLFRPDGGERVSISGTGRR